jgi:hypothetical protein
VNVVVAISSEGQIGPKTEPVAQAVIADYDAETAVERELILRLVSLLWRLRRSALIEKSCPWPAVPLEGDLSGAR